MLLAERHAKIKGLLTLYFAKLRQNARKQFENLRAVYVLRRTLHCKSLCKNVLSMASDTTLWSPFLFVIFFRLLSALCLTALDVYENAQVQSVTRVIVRTLIHSLFLWISSRAVRMQTKFLPKLPAPHKTLSRPGLGYIALCISYPEINLVILSNTSIGFISVKNSH